MKTDSHGSADDDLAELAHTSSAEVHPRRLRLLAGRLPDEHTVPDRYPFETVSPTQDGYVERDGSETTSQSTPLVGCYCG
jgi:hypothetical protein